MKNINVIKRTVSVILIALMLASALVLMGCADDHDHDHDHGKETTNPNLAFLLHSSKLVYADTYPTVASYNKAEVMLEGTSAPSLNYLRVAKIEGNQILCSANNTANVDYIIVDCPIEVTVGDYILCNSKVYDFSSDRFGFTVSNSIYSFYVVFGEEMISPAIISKDNMADIFAGPMYNNGEEAETHDEHDGHNH